jgi:hypothetical protein
MFRTVSQTSINYRHSALSEGTAGAIHGGDRLPWLRAEATGGDDNFAPLKSLDWQVHIYGEATPGIEAACRDRHVPLHVFPWRPAMRPIGVQANALYLIRPDGYVALADSNSQPATLAAYLDARHLQFAAPDPSA